MLCDILYVMCVVGCVICVSVIFPSLLVVRIWWYIKTAFSSFK